MDRRVQIGESPEDSEVEEREGGLRNRAAVSNVTETQEPFMGIKVRRKASVRRDYQGDYLDVPSHPYLMRILQKQGDKRVLFADKVLKFTGTGKMKRRVLLITECAIYMVDSDTEALKRRVTLSVIDKLRLSELSDNFFAVIILTEYDLLLASTRKTEIVTTLVEAVKGVSDYELEVDFSNRFEYHAAADQGKEVVFEEVEGCIRTRIVKK